MSTSPDRKAASGGTPPSTRAHRSPIQTTTDEVAPLTPQESKKLNFLGYGKDHIAELAPERAREIIFSKSYRPGSKAFNNAQPASMRVPDSATDEAIAARNESRRASSGIDILVDEYTQRCVAGDSPLDATLLECQEVFPNDVIRLINPDLPPVAGPQFQPIKRKDGTQVEVGGMFAARLPKDLYEEAYRKPNLERSHQMTGQVTRNKEDADVQLAPEDMRYAPTEGKGLRTEIHSGAF